MINPLGAIGLTRCLVYGALALSIASAIWIHGYSRGELKLYEYQADQARAAVPVVVMQGKVTERVVVQFRDRIVKVKGEVQVIQKEIFKYVPAAADPVLPRGWLLLHDAAARRAIPPPADGADVAAPAVAASQALQGVVGNYGTCHENAEQLVALQDWVRHQFETMNGAQLGY